MIEFVTLFLYLTFGVHPVEVAVADPTVAQVVIQLDDEIVQVIDEPPWSVQCDFGSRPRPQELVAIGLDADGRVLDTARQLINVPRPLAEVRIVLEPDETGRFASARAVWGSHDGARPTRVRVRLDGDPLEVTNEARVWLPALDAADLHILVAELEFADGRLTQSAIGVGGSLGGQISTDLTAVPIDVDPKDPPSLDELRGCIRVDGQSAPVRLVEKLGSRIVLVRSEAAEDSIQSRLAEPRKQIGMDRLSAPVSVDEDALIILDPLPLAGIEDSSPVELFPRTLPMPMPRSAFSWLATSVAPSRAGERGPECLAQAVAVAGLHAASTGAPRAVIVLVDPRDLHQRDILPAHAAAFLAELAVPLHVLGMDSRVSAWGETVEITTRFDLNRFERRLRRDLERQWIAWIDGRHLPSRVEVGCARQIDLGGAVSNLDVGASAHPVRRAKMLSFITLFVGLTTGAHAIELQVASEVSAVELYLDGELVGMATQSPWTIPCDLGEKLLPHRVEAVARDANGQEIDRIEQWVNMRHTTATAEMELVEAEDGRIEAVALRWVSLGEVTPESVEVTFDGVSLDVTNPSRVVLPSYDSSQLHFVSARVRLANEVLHFEEIVGGRLSDQEQTDLTAVAIERIGEAAVPSLVDMEGWFTVDGAPVEAVAVEQPPFELVIVRQPEAQRDLERVIESWQVNESRSAVQRLDTLAQLDEDGRVRFVSTIAAPISQTPIESTLFPTSTSMSSKNGGLLSWVDRTAALGHPSRIADAVALAGEAAHAGTTRRVVVLLLGDGVEDLSQYGVEETRNYLQVLQVPLMVWTTRDHPGANDWGHARAIVAEQKGPGPRWFRPSLQRSIERLSAASRELDDRLRRQYIVWINGRHLPQDVHLTSLATGYQLAGSRSPLSSPSDS